MIERPKYLRQLIDNKENGFPKVITGIRRCGKSSLLKEIYRNYLLSIGVPKENIILKKVLSRGAVIPFLRVLSTSSSDCWKCRRNWRLIDLLVRTDD